MRYNNHLYIYTEQALILRSLESMYSADIVQRGRILDSEYLGLPLKFTDIQFNHLQNGCKNS